MESICLFFEFHFRIEFLNCVASLICELISDFVPRGDPKQDICLSPKWDPCSELYHRKLYGKSNNPEAETLIIWNIGEPGLAYIET
jgi:hypothetical protein